MSGLMTAFIGGAGANGIFTITVGKSDNSGIAGALYSFWGWSTITGPSGAQGRIYPSATMGASSGAYIGGVQILGFYSVDTVSNTSSGTRGDEYYVIVSGNQQANTGLITTLSIGGANLTYSAENTLYNGSSFTYFQYTATAPSIVPTLFGTSIGANKDIIIV